MVWTVRDLSDFCGLSPSYIQKDIKAGRLAARKSGHIWLINDDDAQAWLDKPRRGSRSPNFVKGGDVDEQTNR